jgi:hypothetical protein
MVDEIPLLHGHTRNDRAERNPGRIIVRGAIEIGVKNL